GKAIYPSVRLAARRPGRTARLLRNAGAGRLYPRTEGLRPGQHPQPARAHGKHVPAVAGSVCPEPARCVHGARGGTGCGGSPAPVCPGGRRRGVVHPALPGGVRHAHHRPAPGTDRDGYPHHVVYARDHARISPQGSDCFHEPAPGLPPARYGRTALKM
ncbi:MAG: hypothetical protein AVDCRST_MAG56-2934, partial [uncultured Cytophagales bacterium]